MLDEEERGFLGAEAFVSQSKANNVDLSFYFNLEMIGYTDARANTQTIPTGLDVLFPDAAAELAANDFRANFLAVIVDESGASETARITRWAERLSLPLLTIVIPNILKSDFRINELRRSDHAPFWDEDYAAAMLTDTSEFRYDAYHCRDGEDEVARLDHDFARKVIGVTVGAAAETLQPVP